MLTVGFENMKKEIFVLTGGGHKGSVKITPVEYVQNRVKIECNLDFRPTSATLYIVGDEIAKTTLNDNKTAIEVPFVSNNVEGCVLRSSSLTMFGGRGNRAEILAKIDGEKRENLPVKSAPKTLEKAVKNEPEKESPSFAKLLSETASSGGVFKYNGRNFYLAVKPQIDEMFVCYKAEASLSEAVENSAWVHIDAEDGYYVVGIVKDEEEVVNICYGVPSANGKDVPDELRGVCRWIPVKDENIAGYWVIFQSATSGEIIK